MVVLAGAAPAQPQPRPAVGTAEGSSKKVTITYLEMLAHNQRTAPPPRAGLAIAHVTPTVADYRSLYDAVGSDYDWFSRRKMSHAELGALLGIPIDYYAQLDFRGFIKIVDAVGGVDVTVAKGFDDPTYDGYGTGERGFSITAGPRAVTFSPRGEKNAAGGELPERRLT